MPRLLQGWRQTIERRRTCPARIQDGHRLQEFAVGFGQLLAGQEAQWLLFPVHHHTDILVGCAIHEHKASHLLWKTSFVSADVKGSQGLGDQYIGRADMCRVQE
jgi:hypothetical protein